MFTKGESIEVRLKLKGGSENENKIEILCSNMHGFPSDKNNIEKIKAVDKLLEGKEIAIILETGNNSQQKLQLSKPEMTISKENRMPKIKNSKYQSNGSGTAIFINKKYDHKPGCAKMNDHKHVTCVVQNENGTKWIMAGIHAENGNAPKKWDNVNTDMINLALKYNFPTIVYLDINTDVE